MLVFKLYNALIHLCIPSYVLVTNLLYTSGLSSNSKKFLIPLCAAKFAVAFSGSTKPALRPKNNTFSFQDCLGILVWNGITASCLIPVTDSNSAIASCFEIYFELKT